MNFRIVFCLCLLILPGSRLLAETVSVSTDTLVVRSTRIGVQSLQPLTPDYQDRIFSTGGAAIIQRGGSMTSDLYMDGFKRGDFLFTVDGERHHTACPNRMDLTLGRVNPLDMASMTVSRGLSGLRSGLAGGIDFHRTRPGQQRLVKGIISGSGGASESADVAVSFEQSGTRVSARYLQQANWEDGEGRDFATNYGYLNPQDATLAEIAVHTARDDWDAAASYTSTRDVSFPYLLMDERENDVLSLSAGWRGSRFYFNTAEHLMDNGLRVPVVTMTTDVSTKIFGVTSDRFEVYGRNWDADNTVGPLTNHLMPDVWRYGATGTHTLALADATGLILRAGLVVTRVGDEAALTLHRELYPDAERQLWHIPFGAGLEHRRRLMQGEIVLTTEAVGEAPEIESLYIAVRKPMGKPHWTGNPDLDAPLRLTSRAQWSRGILRCDAFLTRVNNYVQLSSASVGTVNYLTFANLDAYLAGASAFASHRYVDAGLVWNWGQQAGTSTPLAEILPLMLDATLKSPAYGRLSARLHWVHAFEQSRIDREFGETVTADWNRLDLELEYAMRQTNLVLTVRNLTDELYYNHLSFRRDPFASGARVFDPGLTVGLRLIFQY